MGQLFTITVKLILDVVTSLGLAEGSELVDPQVISGAVNYLINRQEKSGRFPVIGRLHNSYLLVTIMPDYETLQACWADCVILPCMLASMALCKDWYTLAVAKVSLNGSLKN